MYVSPYSLQMTIGVYLTVAICIISGCGYIKYFGSIHPNFALGVVGYSVGSVLSTYAYKLNVDHQLNFNYQPTIVAETISFTLNTVCQVLLIKVVGLDSVLSFGLINSIYYLAQVLVMLYYSTMKARPDQDIDLGLWLKPYIDGQGKSRYLFDGALWFSSQLAYNTLLVDFFDQTFFIIFVQSKLVLGELTLIRGFGNLIIRYIYGPVGDITYNLYSKINVECKNAHSDALVRDGISRMVSIVQGVMFVFAFLNYMIFVYSFNTCETWLLLFFGEKWVNPVGFGHPVVCEVVLDLHTGDALCGGGRPHREFRQGVGGWSEDEEVQQAEHLLALLVLLHPPRLPDLRNPRHLRRLRHLPHREDGHQLVPALLDAR